MLYVDSREPLSLVMHLNRALGRERVMILTIPDADYVIKDTSGVSFGLQRKTISDLLDSLKRTAKNGQSSLVDQINRCTSSYSFSGLILEGAWKIAKDGVHVSIRGRTSGWTAASFWGVLRQLQVDYRMVVLPTPSVLGTVALLQALEKRGGSRPW